MSEILKIDYKNEFYPKTLAFRQKILRTPLGMTYGADELKKDEAITYFIYVTNEQVHGCVGFVEVDKTDCRLLQMAVDNEIQGQGVGRKLVVTLEENARNLEFKTVVLDARWDAREFYSKLGYKEYGQTYQKIGLKHINMRKRL